jgi:type IV pilus assembly protein PilW
MQRPAGNANQRGFSLVELMIAMVIGLVLMMGVVDVMVSSKETFQTNEDISRIQENGRYALAVLVRDVRMAGYRDGGGDLPNFFFTGTCDTLTPCTANGAGTASDRIAVQYDPANDTDCFGNAIGVTDLVVNVYSITTANNVSSLSCRAWNATTSAWISEQRALIDGVDGMQILYGLKAGTSESVSQYVSADRVGDWSRVQAVRIALLGNRGTEFGQSTERTRNFVLLDSPTLAFTDRHNRRIYNTTVMLNNATI